eukprot:SAG22_NODE_16341_length_327_cov_0.890351_1_plen_42_part_10
MLRQLLPDLILIGHTDYLRAIMYIWYYTYKRVLLRRHLAHAW